MKTFLVVYRVVYELVIVFGKDLKRVEAWEGKKIFTVPNSKKSLLQSASTDFVPSQYFKRKKLLPNVYIESS